MEWEGGVGRWAGKVGLGRNGRRGEEEEEEEEEEGGGGGCSMHLPLSPDA